MAGINVREVVLDILLELSGQNEYSNVLIASALDKYDYLEGREKASVSYTHLTLPTKLEV